MQVVEVLPDRFCADVLTKQLSAPQAFDLPDSIFVKWVRGFGSIIDMDSLRMTGYRGVFLDWGHDMSRLYRVLHQCPGVKSLHGSDHVRSYSNNRKIEKTNQGYCDLWLLRTCLSSSF